MYKVSDSKTSKLGKNEISRRSLLIRPTKLSGESSDRLIPRLGKISIGGEGGGASSVLELAGLFLTAPFFSLWNLLILLTRLPLFAKNMNDSLLIN